MASEDLAGEINLGEGVFRQTRIENCIGNLITVKRFVSASEKHCDNDTQTHAILSGWPSPTDSEVKRKDPWFFAAVIVMEDVVVGGQASSGGR
jgi:hypothetical protein